MELPATLRTLAVRVFNWPDLLKREGIPYIEKGPNVKRGAINIKCPFCGSADPSYHMGLQLENGWWACWRNRTQHSGKSPVRLIMKLLGVPYWLARKTAGLGDEDADPEGFDAAAARLLGRGASTARPEEVRREFLQHGRHSVPITDRVSTRRAWDYLWDRGFDDCDLAPLVKSYDLRTAWEGIFANRIILPYYLDGQLVTWTARAIGPSEIRYKDLSREYSLVPPKETLFNHDCVIDGGRVLVIQEGPFDALKIDFYGREFGVRSVALSTNSVSDEQAAMLSAADGQFDLKLVMMDNATSLGFVDSMRLKQQLGFLHNVRAVKVPFGAKDGGELLSRQVREWCATILGEPK